MLVLAVLLLAVCVYADETSLKGAIVTRLSQNLEAGEQTDAPTFSSTIAPTTSSTIGLYSSAFTPIVAIASILFVV